MGSMWVCIIVEHKHTPGQFSSYPGSTIGIVAACVYVSLEEPLYILSWNELPSQIEGYLYICVSFCMKVCNGNVQDKQTIL
jgi:hypothetical protein